MPERTIRTPKTDGVDRPLVGCSIQHRAILSLPGAFNNY